jgi:CheY-like chemotaxis protein
MGSRIELTTDIAADIAPVMADPAQVESVVVNLTKNAADAMDGDGKICIRVANQRMDAAQCQATGVGARRCVGISVADDGPGIPDAIKDQIFEPFFSTKGKSRGTGLGLSMVRWIAEELDGAIELDTVPGRGTTFTLLLPATTQTASETAADLTMPLSTLPSGTETMLVVADDPQLRQTIKESLEILGYRVICNDGVSDPFEESPESKIHLMLIDCAIPHGNDILEAVRAREPSIRIVSIGESDTQHAGDEGHKSIVKMPQPFALIDIARTVRRTLDGAASDQ